MLRVWSIRVAAIVLLAGMTQGCMVKASQYKQLRDEHEDTLARMQGMKGDLASKKSEVDRLQALNEVTSKELEDKDAQINALKSGGGASPELREIWKKLESLASGHKDIMKWDAQSRKLLVSVEFESGSSVVKSNAKAALKDIARALKGLSSQYRIYVDGHTDSQPVRNPETLKKYRNNRELSLGRASSVCGVMAEDGTSPRMMIARGFGEYYPVASNENESGRQKNRRVEISVVPASSAFTPTAMIKPESDTAAE